MINVCVWLGLLLLAGLGFLLTVDTKTERLVKVTLIALILFWIVFYAVQTIGGS